MLFTESLHRDSYPLERYCERISAGRMRHILITGLPGVGKTTLIRRMVQCLTDYHPAGFYTQELRVQGVRKGFTLVSLDGRQRILSHVDHRSPYRVGRYRVDVAQFEHMLAELDLCHSSSCVIVIDEIGKMECFSKRFREDVTALIGSSRTVIATVAFKGGEFIQWVKRQPSCHLVTLTAENRERLADDLLTVVLRNLSTPKGEEGSATHPR